MKSYHALIGLVTLDVCPMRTEEDGCISHGNLKQPNKTEVGHMKTELYHKKSEFCHNKTELSHIATWKPEGGGVGQPVFIRHILSNF